MTLSAIGSIGLLWLSAAWTPALAADSGKSAPVKLAVFAFELEDVSPAASFAPAASASDAAIPVNNLQFMFILPY